MRSYRVFSDTSLELNTCCLLAAGPSRHLAAVLRVRVDDEVIAFNGDGFDYRCTVRDVSKNKVTVEVVDKSSPNNESPLLTTLGLAVSKGDRFDWAIKKATELGVSHIAPLLTQRVDVRLPPDRWQKKRAHWQQVVISACEQSGRAVVPEVIDAQPLSGWLANLDADTRLVLDPEAATDAVVKTPKHIALLVGPEGGLTAEEIELANTHNFQALKLGPRVVRTETAPLLALSIVGAHWGDLSSLKV